jgi:predicted phosphohydrolase
MSLFAISDLHLAIGMEKPMDIFGRHWEDHTARLKEEWLKIVGDGDTVIIPGDISWGMTVLEARPDFEFIESLPGRKIISKGNHDYWWSSVRKLENFFEENGMKTIDILKNNSFRIDETTTICGTRGWIMPCDNNYNQKQEIIYKRELGRLRASLESAAVNRNENERIIVALHYPPLLAQYTETEFTQMLEEYNVNECVFGHIHKNGSEKCFEGELRSVAYHNISADKLAFKPLQL